MKELSIALHLFPEKH